MTRVVPSEVERSACMKLAAVFSVGPDRAVMTTVAPPCRNRLAMALPAPFVPPVTRTRLPPNSLAWFAFVLDAVMACSSVSGPCLRLLMGRLSGNNAIARAAVGQCSGHCFVALCRLDAAGFVERLDPRD